MNNMSLKFKIQSLAYNLPNCIACSIMTLLGCRFIIQAFGLNAMDLVFKSHFLDLETFEIILVTLMWSLT